MNREEILESLRAALGAAVRESTSDPQFLMRVAKAICDELGADPAIGMYLVSRLVSRMTKETKTR